MTKVSKWITNLNRAMTSYRDRHSSGYVSNGDETTERILWNTIYSTKTNYKPLPGYEGIVDTFGRLEAGLDVDEVYSNIFIGDAETAKNKQYLKKIGITHVLNTAEGNRYTMVNTSKSYYSDTGINYMGVQLLDVPMTNIGVHFHETADFIEDGIKSGGKVLVHCLMGMSRSSTCVVAYLMIKENLCATEALRTVRLSRNICPNEGFLRQLADLDNKLRRDRERMNAQHQ